MKNIAKINNFRFFFFDPGEHGGGLGSTRGGVGVTKIMKKIGFTMERKSGIRKEIKSPYFGDQKCDV